MAKYIFQLRRGTRLVDENGATLLNADGAPVQDDWATYTAQADHMDPLEGELVLEYEVAPSGKITPRLKIGDGISTFAQLDYMSVDSFILPTPASITLSPDAWQPVLNEETDEPIANRYYQPVTVNNAVITPNSKVDLQPSPEQLAIFHEKDLTFTAINRGGNVRVCVVGQQPTQEYTIQVTATEVA